MQTQKISYLHYQRLNTPLETTVERNSREAKSLKVARQMIQNGCCSNTVARYTGLSEAVLSKL